MGCLPNQQGYYSMQQMGCFSISNIAVNGADGRIYIVDAGNNIIFEGALDGSGVLKALPIPVTDLLGPMDVEVDPINHFVYWQFTHELNGAIMRYKTGGTGVQKVVTRIKNGFFFDLVLL